MLGVGDICIQNSYNKIDRAILLIDSEQCLGTISKKGNLFNVYMRIITNCGDIYC